MKHVIVIWLSTALAVLLALGGLEARATYVPSYPPSGAAGGDLSGNYPSPTVARINGTSVGTAGGALTTGAVLRVTGTSAVDYGALNLASAAAVTGLLPTGNQASQAMGGDVSGTTASATVAKLQGRAVSSSAPTTNYALLWNGTSWAPAQVDLSTTSVTGTLPSANLPSVSLAGDVSCSGSAGSLTSCNVTAVSGSSPIAITPSTLQWAKGTSSPTISQATPTTDVTASDLTIAAQSPYASAVTHVLGGNINLNIPAPVSGAVHSQLNIQEGGTTGAVFKDYFSTTNWGLYLGSGIAPSSTNYALLTAGNNALTVNSGSNQINFAEAGSTVLLLAGSALYPATDLGMTLGNSTHAWSEINAQQVGSSDGNPVKFKNCSFSANADTTLSSAQKGCLRLTLTGTLTGNHTITFPNAEGVWFLDMKQLSLGAFTLTLASGSDTENVSALGTGTHAAMVMADGSNHIAVMQ